MENVKQKEEKSFAPLKAKFGYTNKMAAPKLLKVVVNTSTGSLLKKDSKKNTFVVERLMKITGQKPSLRSAKKSIASFKLRQGDPIGVMVTLRGVRMYSFLDKLLNVALPRTKDFRGISQTTVDTIGNMTLSVKEHTIFPETSDEELKDVFGLAITLVSTAKTRPEALEFFKIIGVPFKSEEDSKKAKKK